MQTLRARDVMTTAVHSLTDDTALEEAAQFLSDRSISGAPVIDGSGRLVGVISLTDIGRSVGSVSNGAVPNLDYGHYLREPQLEDEHFAQVGINQSSGIQVKDIMTPMVFEVPARATIAEVAQTMTRGRIHRVFVTENGKIKGVISALDLLRILGDSAQ